MPARAKTFADRYLDEKLEYGGEWWSREDIIRDLRRMNVPDRSIDRWLQGAEHRKRSGHALLDLPSATSALQ